MAIYDSTIKRVRTTEVQRFRVACLHCGSDRHSWVGCSQGCIHCIASHPGRRCPMLSVALYTPGPFRKSLRADTPEIHPERAAMIATASSPNDPSMAVAPHTSFKPEEGRTRRTGSNKMPLAAKKPIGTSWPANLPMLPKTPDVSILQKKTPCTTNRDYSYEQKVWNDLQRKIKGAVEATAARSKPFNGQNDRDRVAVRVDEALDILRPMILGGALLHLPRCRQLVVGSTLMTV